MFNFQLCDFSNSHLYRSLPAKQYAKFWNNNFWTSLNSTNFPRWFLKAVNDMRTHAIAPTYFWRGLFLTQTVFGSLQTVTVSHVQFPMCASHARPCAITPALDTVQIFINSSWLNIFVSFQFPTHHSKQERSGHRTDCFSFFRFSLLSQQSIFGRPSLLWTLCLHTLMLLATD